MPRLLFPPIKNTKAETILLFNLGSVVSLAIGFWHILCLTPLSLPPFIEWAGEFILHFPIQTALFSLIMACYQLAVRQRRYAFICGANAILLTLIFLSQTFPTKASSVAASSFSILSANVHTANTKMEELLAEILKQDPNVVVALEVNERWVDFFNTHLSKSYPYILEHPRPDNFGIAVYSKIELFEPSIHYFGANQTPSFAARLRTVEQDIQLIAIHPVPPITKQSWELRNEQLQKIAATLSTASAAAIVLGDFNVSPWTPIFRNFQKAGKLNNASQGFGFFPTWGGNSKILFTPIDHAFYKGRLEVTDFANVYLPGSDHQGILVRFLSKSLNNEQ